MATTVDLEKAREMVTRSDEVLSGTPVVRGTRVPVYDVAASVAAGFPTEQILEDYPSLDAEQVRLSAIYAEANPPPAAGWGSRRLFEGAVLVSRRTVPRPRKAK